MREFLFVDDTSINIIIFKKLFKMVFVFHPLSTIAIVICSGCKMII